MKNFVGNDFSNATFGDNTNFQGDNVSQTKSTVQQGMPQDLYESLISEINKISDEDERKDSIDNASKLKDAIQSKNQERAKKLFGWLPEMIRTTASAIAIAKAFNLM